MRYIELLNLAFTKRSTVMRPSNLLGGRNIYGQVLQPIFSLNHCKLRDMFGFDFSGQNMKHPYLSVCQELLETGFSSSNKGLDILSEFYLNYQPSSTLEAFSEFQTRGIGLSSFQLPWEELPNKRSNSRKLGYTGPRTKKQINREYKRIEKVLKSIKNRGYNPKPSLRLFDSGHISGYFLRKDKSYRFIVVHGKHRLAALVALGYSEIPVTFTLGRPRVIEMNDFEQFPGFTDGSFLKKDIDLIIEKFFG